MASTIGNPPTAVDKSPDLIREDIEASGLDKKAGLEVSGDDTAGDMSQGFNHEDVHTMESQHNGAEEIVATHTGKQKDASADNEEEEDQEEEEEDDEETMRRQEGEWYQLTGSCSLVLHRGDITKWYINGKTDAIVNAANEMMLGGGGVDGAIHRAAGKKLLDACYKVKEVSAGVRCPVGRAVITPGFKLPASRVIHTVGPIYHKEENPAGVLGQAYKSSVALAVRKGVKYLAFPAISCGIYGYPYEEAAKVSIAALQETARELSEVHFVFFEVGTYRAWLAEAEEKLDRLTV